MERWVLLSSDVILLNHMPVVDDIVFDFRAPQ